MTCNEVVDLEGGHEFGGRDRLTVVIKKPESIKVDGDTLTIKGGTITGLAIVHNDLEI